MKDFVSETIPQIFSKVMPSRTMLRGLSELLMLSVSVWMETIARIFKLSFSVLLHALWRQGLVIAHSFSRLSADTHLVPNTPILERRYAQQNPKTLTINAPIMEGRHTPQNTATILLPFASLDRGCKF